jgi:hypothetical protein
VTEASREVEIPPAQSVRVRITPDMQERRLRYNIDDAEMDMTPAAWIFLGSLSVGIIGVAAFVWGCVWMSVTGWSEPEFVGVFPWAIGFVAALAGIIMASCNAPAFFTKRKVVVQQRRIYHDYLTDKQLDH